MTTQKPHLPYLPELLAGVLAADSLQDLGAAWVLIYKA